MSIIGSNILAGASGQGGEYTIEESLRFNASQSSYLSWTPASAGNRKTWAWSGWVKRGALGVEQVFFHGGQPVVGGVNMSLKFDIGNTITAYGFRPAVANDVIVTTTQVFRDPSAWYHILVVADTPQATSSNRIKMYVNGVQITSFGTTTYPSQNYDTGINIAYRHNLGSYTGANYLDGYLTEVNFIDGQALDPSSFGEFDSVTGVWKPSEYTGTYGTNGFYLPMKLDNTVEGFNTVTWVGNDSTHNITGVGFSPDLVWTKSRSSAGYHTLMDSVRGASKRLYSNLSNAEDATNGLLEFTSDGFVMGNNATSHNMNAAGVQYVAWCWDAGSSTVSNTDGSITTTLRSSPTYGFAVMTYSGNGTDNATIGHGLGAAPKMLIWKPRNASTDWMVWHAGLSGYNYDVRLNTTSNETTGANPLNNTAPSSSVVTLRNQGDVNGSGTSIVCYAFAEVAGYSKFGSYTGTGASGNTVTTGFKPAFVMVKRTDSADNWRTYDSTRDIEGAVLYPNLSNVEDAAGHLEFTDTGWTWLGSNSNASGGTYIYMAFKDTREYAYWLDDSGNNNDWQPNGGITTESTVTDTPTPYADGGNYAVLNPLSTNSGFTLSNGNLNYNESGGISACRPSPATMAISSGKWYWEVNTTTVGGGNYTTMLGIWDADNLVTSYTQNRVNGFAYATNGDKVNASATASYGSAMSNADVIGVAFDADAGTITFYKNNTSQGTAFTGISGSYAPVVCFNSGTTSYSMSGSANFGQRPFAYTPPTGFLPLHTGNLPDSAIVDGSEYFAIDTYSGTGATNARTIGFQPDFVWIKARTNAYWHKLFDSVRGANKPLVSNDTTAELTETTGLMSFDSDGFTLGTSADSTVNNSGSGQTYVAWNWKANGAGVSNTDGSITSTVSANPTSGFSIVTYTGNVVSGATVGHGLGAAPKLIIIKSRVDGYDWIVYHASIGNTGAMRLNSTVAVQTDVTWFNNSGPSSTTFTLGNTFGVNRSGSTYVAYCFADVEGYSKFGSYTGNGSSDGVFVHLGFRPRFVLFRSTSARNWVIRDTSRNTYNAVTNDLYPDSASAEYASGDAIDFLSNGFKLRATGATFNGSGEIYIYMAFAENPFKNSLAR